MKAGVCHSRPVSETARTVRIHILLQIAPCQSHSMLLHLASGAAATIDCLMRDCNTLTVHAAGVGWSLRARLSELAISKVRQVWSTSKENLMRKLGRQTGMNLWNYAHGRDDRPVEPPKVSAGPSTSSCLCLVCLRPLQQTLYNCVHCVVHSGGAE